MQPPADHIARAHVVMGGHDHVGAIDIHVFHRLRDGFGRQQIRAEGRDREIDRADTLHRRFFVIGDDAGAVPVNHAKAGIEQQKNSAADQASGDPHQDSTDGSTRITTWHDGFGRQADESSKSDPHQQFVCCVITNYHQVGVSHDSLHRCPSPHFGKPSR